MSDPRRSGSVDVPRATIAVLDLLTALGYDPSDPSLVDTPDRVARAWAELLDADTGGVTRSFQTAAMDEMVVLRGITGWSICEHHLLPFSFRAAVGYIPRLSDGGLPPPAGQATILGLSKLARVVRRHAAALQLQERMTAQIADTIEEAAHPRGVAVRVEGVHLCAVMRGVQAEQAEFVTTDLRGAFMDKPEARAEFLAAAK